MTVTDKHILLSPLSVRQGKNMTNLKKKGLLAYEKCTICPRNCGKDRNVSTGVCGAQRKLTLARAALHYWEEPCISGTSGSGAVFFSGCGLGCVFCQNREIARGKGFAVEDGRLAEIFLELEEQGANNINLVTGGAYIPHIIGSVEKARAQGLSIPILYNTGSYEKVDSLKALEGIVDIYLPDFKFMDEAIAARYCRAADYAPVAKAAIAEMVRQQPALSFYEKKTADGHGTEHLLEKGVMVRQLLLPGQLHDAKQILRYLFDTYENRIAYSLMSQYTPLPHVKDYPELMGRVSVEAYEAYIAFAGKLGITVGYTQEREVAEESFIPLFDGEGV
jgi:putative pyruvate formate lyase activating enzyme